MTNGERGMTDEPPVHRFPFAPLAVCTTSPTEASARQIAELAVAERLAACAQVGGPLASVFWWNGSIDRANEWICILKTTQGKFAALEARIRSLHSYEVPEIIAIPIVAGSAAYLEWIRASVEG